VTQRVFIDGKPATSYTFDYSDIDGQDFVAYQVTASFQDDYYISSASTSDIVIVGQPETLPFVDSFTDGNYAQMWAVDPDSQGDFMNGTLWDNELQTNADAEEGVEPEYLNSQDADNGFFLFLPYQKDATYGFFSTKIDISGAANPVFEFFLSGQRQCARCQTRCRRQAFRGCQKSESQGKSH